MKIYPIVRTALKALQRNPMRAMLTTLGIVIGIGAVIAMMEVGAGSSAAIQKKITSMGANGIIIIPKTAVSGGVSYGAGSAMTLTTKDCDAIIKSCPLLHSAAPIVRARAQVVYLNRNWVPESIEGTKSEYLDVRQWPLEQGEPFTERDVKSANQVCLLGHTIAGKLFGNQSPIGKTIRLRNISLRVIGVLSKKGANLMGQDQDDILLAPWTTIKYRIAGSRLRNTNQSTSTDDDHHYYVRHMSFYPDQAAIQKRNSPLLIRFANIDAIMAATRSADLIADASEEITEILRIRHGVGPGEEDFEIINLTEIAKALSSTTTIMTNLLLCIAAVSLIVGGVGIMNIMLVSVTERTHEIGLRMAVGARSRDILNQFLVEAIALCVAGGVVGILFGNTVSYLIWKLLDWPVKASPMAAAVAVCVSVSVGIIFGFYPAWKASQLNPIEALRYE